MNLHFETIDIISELIQILFGYLHFHPGYNNELLVFILGSLLLVQH